jgi:transcription elongation factor GreB
MEATVADSTLPVAQNARGREINDSDTAGMSKAFVKDDAGDGDDDTALPELAPGVRNYITQEGYARLREELAHLVKVERPEVVRVVSWAASNGDRSENGDYIYGKKRLREIDRRIRFLTKRLDLAEVVEVAARPATDQVFFGATVRYEASGRECEVMIVGIDEVDPARGRVSWISPIARALLKAHEGDLVQLRTPAGVETLTIVKVSYAAS